MAKRNKKSDKKQLTVWDVLIGIGIASLIGLAVREQLQMPPEERTWHGKLYGIPYDFRRPTIERLRETFWNKNTSRILVPHAFGMGWSINFYPLINPPTTKQISEIVSVK